MQRIIVLTSVVLCAVVLVETTYGNPTRLDSETLGKFHDIFHGEAPTEYDVTYPYQSTPDGKFLSHDLRSSHRVRRSGEISDEHHYSLKAFGKTLHLNLRENKDLIAPGLELESHDADGKVKRTPIEPGRHYIGRVRGYPGSSVAISNHGALSGKIVLDGETLYIRPAARKMTTRGDGRSPHIIYKPEKKSDQIDVLLQDMVYSDEENNSGSDGDVDPNNNDNKYYLELAFAVDKRIAAKYGKLTADVLLIISNVAAQAYQDASIGEKKIILVVTRLVIIAPEQLKAKSISLEHQIVAFQRWAANNNPSSDSDPNHFDIAALMRAAPGGTGLASYNTVCGLTSVNVISDNGIQSWPVLAHEIGHNLGIDHDGGANCTNFKNIMSTLVPGGPGSREWSACSRNRFTKLFSQGRYHCLLDEPQVDPKPTISPARQGKLPGILFDRTRQCQMQNGPRSVACSGDQSCGSLYCGSISSPSSCTSTLAAVMDGTRCGIRNWCMKFKCVDDGSPRIHGGWSSWSTDYIPCTRSCDGGIKYRTRSCTNPVPQNGGNNCKGVSKGFIEICNDQKCPGNYTSYRTLQCKQLDPSFLEAYHGWRTCILHCKLTPITAVVKGNVKDGTKCDRNPAVLDICIQGKCLAVGCDLKVGDAKRDRCGVCNGDGTSCRLVKGSYTKDHLQKGTNNADTIVVLPIGALNITVTEREATYNLIGVTAMDGKFLFKVPNRGRTITAAGTRVTVSPSRGNAQDHVYIHGPITEQLKIVYVYKRGSNKGIDYSFYEQKPPASKKCSKAPSNDLSQPQRRGNNETLVVEF